MVSNLKPANAWAHLADWIRSAAPSRLYAAGGWGLLSSLAFIVVIRAAVGAFSGPICPLCYGLCLLLTSLLCGSLKLAADWLPHRLSARASLIFGVLITLPLDCLALALLSAGWSYLGAAATIVWLALVTWFCVSSHSADGIRRLFGTVVWPEIERFLCPDGTTGTAQRAATRSSANSPAHAPQMADLPRESLISLARDPALNDQLADDAEGELVSRLQRRTLDTGIDLLEGQLVATFDRGAKQTVLHVPFTPPFSVPPQVDCEVADGSDVRIKVGTVFTYGVRVELKRSSTDLPQQHVAVEIYAESPARR